MNTNIVILIISMANTNQELVLVKQNIGPVLDANAYIVCNHS
jgi:hypothetical protein